MDIRNTHGFSMLEMVAALAITAVLAAIAVPTWGKLLPLYQLDSSVRQLQSELHNIKGRAAVENVSFEMQWLAGSGEYAIYRDAAAVVTKPLPDGVIITKAGNVSFSPRGTAAANRIRLRNAQGTCTQLVISATGRVRLCKPAGCASDC